jgi:hypothetical protein
VEESCQLNRESGNGTIGNPVGICIVTLKTPKPRRGKVAVTKTGHIGQGLSQRAKAHQGSEDRGLRIHVHRDITNPETPIGRYKAVVME